MPKNKEWTLIFYLASDNPLAPGIISQLKAIKAAGFHKQANVLVQFDPYTEETPTHVFDVNVIKKVQSAVESNIGFTANDPFVYNLVEDKLWRDEKDRNGMLMRDRLKAQHKGYDPGIPPNGTVNANGHHHELSPEKSLKAFLEFCAANYPANHYMLFILGHGVVVGNEVFLFDDHADEQTLTLDSLRKVLETFNTHIRKHKGNLELVSFHSCSVSSLEVAYELKDTANYMLASQGSTFVGSWPYRQILIRIFNDLPTDGSPLKSDKIPGMLERIFQYCVHNSTDFLLAGYPFDLCLCNLRRVGEAKAAVDKLARALSTGLASQLLKESILLSHLKGQSFYQEMYTDLIDFCRCLFRETKEPFADQAFEQIRTGIREACRDVVGTVRSSIVRAGFAGPEYQYSGGLSVYFPWSRPLDEILEQYAVYKFAEAKHGGMSWLGFLKEYFDKTRRESFQKEEPIKEFGEVVARAATVSDELLEDQLALVYSQATPQVNQNVVGSLSLQKIDKTDPMGGDCSCPSIKNYPRDTRRLTERRQAQFIPVDADLAGDVSEP